MTARKFDIEVEQGALFQMTLVYRNAAGALIDLTNYTAAMQVREVIGGRVYASASVANGRITVNASGQIVVTIPASETKGIGITQGVYDLFLTSPDGIQVQKLLYGDAVIAPSVTRA